MPFGSDSSASWMSRWASGTDPRPSASGARALCGRQLDAHAVRPRHLERHLDQRRERRRTALGAGRACRHERWQDTNRSGERPARSACLEGIHDLGGGCALPEALAGHLELGRALGTRRFRPPRLNTSSRSRDKWRSKFQLVSMTPAASSSSAASPPARSSWRSMASSASRRAGAPGARRAAAEPGRRARRRPVAGRRAPPSSARGCIVIPTRRCPSAELAHSTSARSASGADLLQGAAQVGDRPPPAPCSAALGAAPGRHRRVSPADRSRADGLPHVGGGPGMGQLPHAGRDDARRGRRAADPRRWPPARSDGRSAAADGREQLGLHQHVGHPSRLAGLESRCARGGRDVGAAPSTATARASSVARAQAFEPLPHEAPDRAGPTVVTASAASPVGSTSAWQRGHELAQEQRVAAGRPVASGAELLVDLSAEPAPQNLPRRRRPAQRTRAEHLGRRVARELSTGPSLSGSGTRAAASSSTDSPPAARQVAEESQRGRIRPVGVVDHEHERPAVREVHGEPVQPVERPGRRIAVLGLDLGTILSNEPRGESRRPGKQRPALLLRGGAHGLLEQPPGNAEGESRSSGAPRAPRTGTPRLLGARTRAGQQAALADPGRPSISSQPPAPSRTRATAPLSASSSASRSSRWGSRCLARRGLSTA